MPGERARREMCETEHLCGTRAVPVRYSSARRLGTLAGVQLNLSQDAEADALLSKEPLALLIGMVLDQQVPLEWAFAGPAELKRRLGDRLDARTIASMDTEQLVAAFSARPALHRYPGSMARRVQELCRALLDDYGGEARKVWNDASSGSQLLDRMKKLPGFGDHKAKIFVALLGKQLEVRPKGWEEASSPFSESGSFRSVADIVDSDSLAKVRLFKQTAKAAQRVPQRRHQRNE
jgi:uncharacterized HhH-GPD family protein